MNRFAFVGTVVLLGSGCLGRTDVSCTDTATCGAPNDASADSQITADGPDGRVPVDGGSIDAGPDANRVEAGRDAADGVACDDNATPAQSACVIRSDRGVFVSPTGNDGASGASDAPLKTIQAALAKAKASARRVYICEGTYDEQVATGAQLDGLFVYGGIDCAAGTYNATKRPVVARGWRADGLTVGLTLEDVEIRSADATAVGTSSIAVIANASKVVLKRVKILAGKGATGQAGSDGAKGDDAVVAGPQQQGTTASCPAATEPNNGGAWSSANACGSRGGRGGTGSTGTNGSDGFGGTPTMNVNPPSVINGGKGGAMGADGLPGSPGSSGALGTSVTATETWGASGYTSGSAAGSGTDGFVGQGGGGGGASNATTAGCVGASGGAGGMGGCGGRFGTGGAGGGASIALLSFQSSVTLDACDLVAAAGGAGGNGGNGGLGGAGKDGATGGMAVAAGPLAAGKGGKGGDGGPGGAGAGGNGGPSYAIAYQGTAPPPAGGSTMTHGTGGAKGTGGTAGAAKAADGAVGAAGDTFIIP